MTKINLNLELLLYQAWCMLFRKLHRVQATSSKHNSNYANSITSDLHLN